MIVSAKNTGWGRINKLHHSTPESSLDQPSQSGREAGIEIPNQITDRKVQNRALGLPTASRTTQPPPCTMWALDFICCFSSSSSKSAGIEDEDENEDDDD